MPEFEIKKDLLTGHTELVFDTFTNLCLLCGATVQFTKGQEEPHRCRIDLDAQRGGS